MEFITSLTTVSGCPTKSENLSGGGGGDKPLFQVLSDKSRNSNGVSI